MSMAPSQRVGADPDPASTQWNYGAVQSVTGGVILPNDGGSTEYHRGVGAGDAVRDGDEATSVS
jgi:hypothetical protein